MLGYHDETYSRACVDMRVNHVIPAAGVLSVGHGCLMHNTQSASTQDHSGAAGVQRLTGRWRVAAMYMPAYPQNCSRQPIQMVLMGPSLAQQSVVNADILVRAASRPE